MVYIVEDDGNIRQLVEYTFNKMNMEAKGFENAGAFWRAMEEATPDIVLLDIMLPDEDGLSILKKIRSNSKIQGLPVIMLTAKGSEYDKVSGLNMGADDYVPKPFGIMELVARVNALLRRVGNQKMITNTCKEFTVGDLYVNVDKHIVKAAGTKVVLTLKEFELLVLLFENKNMVLTRDKILESIWGYNFDGETRTVDVHVRTLRQKLGECGNYINTIRGIGYKISEDGADSEK
ncbi:MAG: response regulator transcription factor [Clostridiales bacterium]|nr:response regulator transcription factor [Clostridiales bacterium]